VREKQQGKKLAGALLCLMVLAGPTSAQDVVTEPRKLINVIGVNLLRDFGYLTLFKRESSGCGPHGLLTVGMETEEQRLLFSTLLAAKTASRAVTVSFNPNDGCAITSAHIH
jgi:hypothetical protein